MRPASGEQGTDVDSWAKWKLLGNKTEQPTAEVPRGQPSGLGNTGLPSECSCDPLLGVSGEAGHPQASPTQPCSYLPSLLL